MKIAIYKPGIVLSKMNPIVPPTNILVLSRTVIIWSTISEPVINMLSTVLYFFEQLDVIHTMIFKTIIIEISPHKDS